MEETVTAVVTETVVTVAVEASGAVAAGEVDGVEVAGVEAGEGEDMAEGGTGAVRTSPTQSMRPTESSSLAALATTPRTIL